MKRQEIPGQLSIEDMHLRVVARSVPQNLSPVMRWRKIVRRVLPPEGSRVSVACFRAVAGVMADYANREGGSVFPSVALIARDAGYQERATQYALRALEQRRLIIVEKRGGYGRATRYRLNVPSRAEPGENVVDGSVGDESMGARDDASRVHVRAPEVRHVMTAIVRDDRGVELGLLMAGEGAS